MNEFRITRGHSCTGKDCVRPPPRSPRSGDGRSRAGRSAAAPARPNPDAGGGLVIVSGDGRRYVEDNKLWTTLGNELQTNDVASVGSPASTASSGRDNASSSETALFFGRQRLDNLALLHPSAVQAFNLWQAFLSNVHPLTKLLHAPSVQETILRAVSEPSSMARSTEALMFAIYLLAVVSMPDDDCRRVLGDTKEKLLDKYCRATEEALNRVDFLRSTDLEVFQAFVLYLLALRHLCDHSILWLLTGLATRIGQRMGLHRESSLKGLSPFEAEMRRRVWWQVVILDGRAAQLAGASMRPDGDLLRDIKQPININDSDLVPSMGTLPPPSTSVTDMVFCSVRYEIGTWMIQNDSLLGPTPPGESSKTKFMKSIDELECQLEEKYLRGIDTNVPLNLLTTYLAQSAVSQLRLSVYDPIHQPERDADLGRDQLHIIFENSLKVIQFDILANSTPSLRRYIWHVSNFFPFETFVLLVSTLPGRAAGPIVDVAWDVINQVYELHPCFITDTSDPLYSALGDLTLKSWSRWCAVARAAALDQPHEPPCIAKLLAERGAPQPAFACAPSLAQVENPPAPPPSTTGDVEVAAAVPQNQGDYPLPLVDDMDATVDWAFWQQLLESSGPAGWDQQDLSTVASWMANFGYPG
ncbi:uncharacterized protein THITE_43844 [Thermothielavioides terrestris NRRL 8126]|uniref:Xylanolytic transcriptional activator regulatory domain-containing protein n=1 Tax=Thermothielavioides terrestris (strain ATCC 38088 / NRRL 8126) TaxID=578455 RepID=G2R8T3_THETT|nr:uncharacterized protein THITE_43844 [Thermothielavioides terrestris NRRL 8126]AEO68582.1 hypothetical protein THITE_43844 [Thermothielavioides terrestris NRRL 8126]